MSSFNYTFVCRNPMPALKCALPESYVLAFLFLICALVSTGFMIFHFRKSKAKIRVFDQTIVFWFFLAIWQYYRFVVTFVAFSWTQTYYNLLYSGLKHYLLFIPMCLVILILFDLLFTYRNPGTNAIFFFRSLFVIFLITFLVIGLTLGIIDSGEATDPDISLSLWCACTDLVLALFFVFPAKKLLDAVKYPMVQPEDESCISFCTVGYIVYTILFILRSLWNFLHFFDVNPLQNMETEDINRPSSEGWKPALRLRLIHFFFDLIFDIIPSVMSMISVFLFKKHDMMFNENPYYTRPSD